MIPVIVADCSCHCAAEAYLDQTLIRMLSRLERRLETPLFITSSGRCVEYNTAVGGSNHSQHLIDPITREVRAVDITSADWFAQRHKIIQVADNLGFKGIGIYPGHRHLDLRLGIPARWPKNKW